MAIELYDNITETMLSSTIGRTVSSRALDAIGDMSRRYNDRLARVNRSYYREVEESRKNLARVKRARQAREALIKATKTRISLYEVDEFLDGDVDDDTLALMYRVLPNAKDEIEAAKKDISILLELDKEVNSKIMEVDSEELYPAIMSGYADDTCSYDEYASSEVDLSFDDICKMDILKDRLRGIGFQSI